MKNRSLNQDVKRIVLSLCDRTGNMVKPWAAAGYECVCVDIQHEPGWRKIGNIWYVGADLRQGDWKPWGRYEYLIAFAFPPCTHLASSGARWFKNKGLAGLIEGLTLVERCRQICEESGAPWMLENPVGTLSTYWRKPDYKFDPCDYGGYQGGGRKTATRKRPVCGPEVALLCQRSAALNR